jgi:hypothetical protein
MTIARSTGTGLSDGSHDRRRFRPWLWLTYKASNFRIDSRRAHFFKESNLGGLRSQERITDYDSIERVAKWFVRARARSVLKKLSLRGTQGTWSSPFRRPFCSKTS